MANSAPTAVDLFSVRFLPDWSFSVQISFWITMAVVAAGTIYGVWRYFYGGASWKEFEIDQAEIGTGAGKLRLKPNMTDRQVAYAIWVELSTRKIGLPIDFEHDVIAEVYNSWYEFFAVTRELVKSIPVNKVRRDSTQKIIKISIEVLNEGLRPHLTMWQARFRRWYENQVNKASGDLVVDPQEIQRQFPRYEELKTDMERVNQRLISYRNHMRRLVMTE